MSLIPIGSARLSARGRWPYAPSLLSTIAVAAVPLVLATEAWAQTPPPVPSEVQPAPASTPVPIAPAEAPSASSPGSPAEAAPPAQITIRPVEVTARKAKKRAPSRAAGSSTPAEQPAPAATAVTAGGPATANAQGGGEPVGPVTVQGQTQLGRLTIATPLAGTVVEREELEEVKAADQVRELLRRVPGVSLIRNIRIPIGGKAYTNNLVDGLSVRSASLGNTSFLEDVNTSDIEAIEVTRGPGSVLHSSKAIGGTINVITRDPGPTSRMGVAADWGQYGFGRLGAFASGATANGMLGASVNALAFQDDGWRERTARDKEAVSGKIVIKPDADTKVTIRGEYVDFYREFPGVLTQSQFDQNWRQAVPKNLYEDLQYATGMVSVKRRVGDGGELELAYVAFQNTGVNACPAGCSNSVASTGRETVVDYVTNNLRGVYRQDFDFLKSRVYVGIDAFLSDKQDTTYNRTGLRRTTLRNDYMIEETSLAPFAQLEVSPFDRLRFTFGMRYEDYELQIDDRSPASNKDGTKTYSDLVHKGGVTYELFKNHRLWGSIAEGFYVPDTASTVTGANPKDLPPETSLTYGAGIRGELGNRLFAYDVGYYYSTIENQAVSLPCNGSLALCPDGAGLGATYAAAAGEVLFEGIESAISFLPWKFIRFDVAHTYALNTYIDFQDASGDFSGKYFQASPKHHVNARVAVYPFAGMRVELEGDYISRYFTNQLNSDAYQRPVLYNLRTSYRLNEHVEVWGHAINLLDTKYADRISATNAANPVRSFSEGYVPLTLRAGVSLKW